MIPLRGEEECVLLVISCVRACVLVSSNSKQHEPLWKRTSAHVRSCFQHEADWMLFGGDAAEREREPQTSTDKSGFSLLSEIWEHERDLKNHIVTYCDLHQGMCFQLTEHGNTFSG